jgi:hypothetical protein
MRTILCLVSDDRQGRKGGVYGETAKYIEYIIPKKLSNIEVHNWGIESLTLLYPHRMLTYIDAGINGRCYKPMAIMESLKQLSDGDFLIYNDCSPELWENIPYEYFSLDVIHNLTINNNDILTCFVKWDCQNIPADGLGIHIHKYFTLNRCMDKMGLRQYENSYQHASGMMCIRKTPETVKFVEEWLAWNLDPECASLGNGDDSYWNEEQEFKVGHRHDQSISGLLLNARNAKLVDILYNDMAPYNFLQYCRPNQEYKFIDSNSPVDRAELDMSKVFIRRGSRVYNEQGVEITVFRVDYIDGKERFIVGHFEESAWATTRDKIRLKK